MVKCDFCGEEATWPFVCNYCGGSYCVKHRLPESHSCESSRAARHMERIESEASSEKEKHGEKHYKTCALSK